MSERKSSLQINRVGKATIYYTASSIFARGVNFIFTPIYTRLMSQSELGIYSLYLSFLSIFTVITTFEMHGSVSYRALSRYKSAGFIKTATLTEGAVMLFFLLIYILFSSRINAISALSTSLFLIMFLSIFLNTVESFILSKARYEGKYVKVSFINILSGAMNALLTLLLVSNMQNKANARIASALIISLLIVPILFFKEARRETKEGASYSRELSRYLILSSVPLLIHFLFTSILANTDKILVYRLLGEKEAGEYSVAHTVSFIFLALMQGLISALTPWLIKNREKKRDILPELFGTVLFVAIIAMLLFETALPELFLFIGGKANADALASAYPLQGGVVMLLMSSLFSALSLCYTKRFVILSSLVSSLFFIILSPPLILRFGKLGASTASLLGYTAFFILSAIAFKKSTGFFPIERKMLAKCALIFSLISPLPLLFRASLPSRLLLALASLALLFSHSQKIKKILLTKGG